MTMSVSVLVYLNLGPTPTDRFFSMWILGSDGLTENYFPNNNPNLILGETVNWTLGVYNHMSALEYIVVRVKLLNSSQTSPNELTGVPSPVPTIFEFARILTDNETWSIPFVWSISDMTNQQGSVQIKAITVNQTTIPGILGEARAGLNFRLVFELWFYDHDTGNLIFFWSTPTGPYSVWTQMWFNATATS